MRFRVENLGPLREAEVDLSKRLIVLTGPNNTGKTYFATAVYGFFRTPAPVPRDLLSQPPFTAHEFEPRTLRAFSRADFQGNLDACFGTAPGELVDARVRAPSWLRPALGRFRGDHGGHVHVRRSLDDGATYEFALLRDSRFPHIPVTEQEWMDLPIISSETPPGDIARMARSAILMLWSQMTDQGAAIFPAERLAIDLFAGEIAATRLGALDDVLGDRAPNALMRRLTWPIRDAIRFVLKLPLLIGAASSFSDLVADLERSIMGGTLGVSHLGVATFTPHGAEKRLDVQQAASVVKSLSSLVFHLRHQALRGDLLIIDEPELNLHPDNQRKVARFLARAVNRGFRILISTHSDYVLRELNQLLQLGRPDERAKKLVQELGYPEDALLQPADIGVYLFQGGTAKEVEVSEEGFEVKTIEDEIAELNVLQQKIYSAFLD